MTAITGTDVDDGVHEVSGFRFHIDRPIVAPSGIAAFTAADTGECFEVVHRVEGLAISGELATGNSPEVVHFGAWAAGFRMNEVIRAKLQTSTFCAGGVRAEVRIGITGAFDSFGIGIVDSVTMDAGPVDGALIVRDVDAEQAVCGVVGTCTDSSEERYGGDDALD